MMTSTKLFEETLVHNDHEIFCLHTYDDFVEVDIIKKKDDLVTIVPNLDENGNEISKITQPNVKQLSIWQKFKRDFLKLREANFPCKLCNERCLSSMALERHIYLVHASKNYDFMAGYHVALKKNTSSVHTLGVTYPCNQCDFKASQQDKLRKHKVSVHEGGIKYLKYF